MAPPSQSGPGGARPTAPAPVPAETYRFLVASAAEDQVTLIRFTPCQPSDEPPACGARVERTYPVGRVAPDSAGLRGVVVSPDGKTFYVSLAHTRPAGRLEKYDVATGRQLGAVDVGLFPAALDIAPDGALVYVANFNVEDPEMRPSSVSVVRGETMTELARLETCRMPHGSRFNAAGTRHYSACLMNDLVVEVDAGTRVVQRLFRVAPGREGPVTALAHGRAGDYPVSRSCTPTGVEPSADGGRVYVACHQSGDVAEVDVATWALVKRWRTPPMPYNLAASPDGKLLVVTHQGPGTLSIWRLADDQLLAEVPGSRSIASDVAVSPDSRFAFVTFEGAAGEPGAIDIVDLKTLRKVATLEIGRQAGAITLLP